MIEMVALNGLNKDIYPIARSPTSLSTHTHITVLCIQFIMSNILLKSKQWKIKQQYVTVATVDLHPFSGHKIPRVKYSIESL